MVAHQTLSSTFSSDMKKEVKEVVQWAVFTASFVATIELASRVDQWLTYGAPILGVYTYDSALFTSDEYGIRGKPNGHYEKWILNSSGFRGDDVTLEKPASSLRVVCIGASETFGFYEQPGNEWPHQLEQALLHRQIQGEVINGAIAGMSLPQRIQHLKNRLLPFKPDVVIFMLEYGSYAGLTSERIEARERAPMALPVQHDMVDGVKSLRVMSRLKDVVLPKLPMPIQELVGNMKRRLQIRAIKQELGPAYRSFQQVQPFERQALERDLETLRDLAETAGVRLILVSPAMWFTERNLADIVLSWPYLDESWWREAGTVLPLVAKAFARQHDVFYIDLSETMRGSEEIYMRDFLHFSDRGAKLVADVIAEQVTAKPSFSGMIP